MSARVTLFTGVVGLGRFLSWTGVWCPGLIVSAPCEQSVGTTSNDLKITDEAYQRRPWNPRPSKTHDVSLGFLVLFPVAVYWFIGLFMRIFQLCRFAYLADYHALSTIVELSILPTCIYPLLCTTLWLCGISILSTLLLAMNMHTNLRTLKHHHYMLYI